jgi:hypothetical protein
MCEAAIYVTASGTNAPQLIKRFGHLNASYIHVENYKYYIIYYIIL